MEEKELLERYAGGERDFRRTNLQRAYLRDAYLQGTNLRGAYLQGANLQRADLRGANLERANLQRANLQGAYLQGANLQRADLERADLRGADLRDADLRDANVLLARYLYCVRVPGMSSRTDFLGAHVALSEDNKIVLRFRAGCYDDVTADELRAQVRETHGESSNAMQYMLAIDFLLACFEIDMKAGRWDYMLTWKPVDVSEETE